MEQNGVLYVLDHVPDAGEAVVYRGRIEIAGASAALEVRVEPAATPDGLRATAEAPEAPSLYDGSDPEGPERLRAWLERMAAAMTKSAVRSARRTGRRLPRRLQRWRELP